MTPEERALADAYERDLLDKALIRGSAYTEGKAEGMAEGRAEGVSQRNNEIALAMRALSVTRSARNGYRAMLAAGKPRAEILQFSRLTEEELDKLMY